MYRLLHHLMTFNLLTKNTTLTGLTSSSDGVNKQPVGVFNFMEEIWKSFRGFEGLYQVSNFGRVKRVAHTVRNKQCSYTIKESIVKQYISDRGYYRVRLTKNGKLYTKRVHRLVAECFVKVRGYGTNEVNHIDCNKLNNRFDNLEWVTRKENMVHASKNGLMRNGKSKK